MPYFKLQFMTHRSTPIDLANIFIIKLKFLASMFQKCQCSHRLGELELQVGRLTR